MDSTELMLAKLTEAYCIENNLPIKRRFTHSELEESIDQVRHAGAMLYGLPVAAEACTELVSTPTGTMNPVDESDGRN